MTHSHDMPARGIPPVDPDSDESGVTSADDGHALALFRRALDGDGDAWHALFSVQEAHMRQVLRNRIPLSLRPRLDTEDLMQSAFLKLTQVGSGLEIADARSLRAWLARVLMNKLRDRLRAAATAARQGLGTARPSTEVMEQQAADGPTLDQLAQEAELAARMYERMLSLHGVDRDIVILRFVDRLSWTEIARRTGLAATTVSNRYRELIDTMVRGFF